MATNWRVLDNVPFLLYLLAAKSLLLCLAFIGAKRWQARRLRLAAEAAAAVGDSDKRR
ncbi:small integral membrane protein 11A-like [Amblyraja radiata]|uniref:small integral membrane protein 11A-like n=1 Tax=Amblyraja radiata TaxID=386614 RepID=UPI0014023586|nr:small integral membrane protein 11A-like [Amblyraja radiata]